MTRFLFITALLLLAGVTLAANACRDNALCCATFDFQRPSDPSAAPYGDITTLGVAAGSDGPWASQGIEWTLDETNSLSGLPYPLGLVNVSKTAPTVAGASFILAPGEDMVLAAFEYFPTTLLRRTSTMHVKLQHQPACIASVRTVRSLDFDHRQSVRATTFRLDALSGSLSQVQDQRIDWHTTDQLPGVSPLNTLEFTALHIDELKVLLYGQGYGAVAAVEVCYAAPYGIDRCGVCGGDGAGCDAPGSPCNTGMDAPCAAGTLDANLTCVPNLASQPELCNGLDDNCDGLVDNADFGAIECGVGACRRSYSLCINGETNSRCVPGQPSAEICDGIDNDCDGVIDNGDVCISPSTTPSQSPSVSATASRTPSTSPSQSATPSPAPLVQRPAVLVPRGACVRRTETPGVWQAVFGYAYTGAGTDLNIAVHPAHNWLVSAHEDNQPQPTLFRANTEFAHAFQVLFDQQTSVQWRLNASTAMLNAHSALCEPQAEFGYEPVAPHFDGCVRRVGDQCFARVAYVNPNPQSIELPAAIGTNWFSPGPQDRRQPRVFWPGAYVIDAAEVSIDCALAQSWSLNWTLVTHGVARVASVDYRNEC